MKVFYITSANFKADPLPAHCHHILNQLEGFESLKYDTVLFVKSKSFKHLVNCRQYENKYISVFLRVLFAIINSLLGGDKFVIHSRDRFYAALALSLIGVKVGVELHSPIKINSFVLHLLRYSIRIRSIVLFSTSSALASHFSSNNYCIKPIVLENGISESFLNYKYRPLSSIDNIHICLISSPRLGKGQEQLIEISNEYPSFSCNLIGRLHPSLENLRHNVHILGNVPQSKVSSMLDNFNIFLCLISPNMGVSGGRVEDGNYSCPLKMFEYISTGRPILISPRISLIETFGHLPSVFVVQDDLSDLHIRINQIKKLSKTDLDVMRSESMCFIRERTWKSRAKKILKNLNS